MTVVVPGVGVITKKSRCKQLLLPVEIPAARFSCLTSGSFRPKLGLCILLITLTGCLCLIILPLLASYDPFSVFSSSFESSSHRNMELKNKDAVRKMEESNKHFNVKLYEHVVRGKNENIVVSPFSIQSVLSMVLSGANGETANQIRAGLYLPEDEHLFSGQKEILSALNDKGENFTLKTAYRLYIQNGFPIRPDFIDFNKKTYLSVPEIVKFEEGEKTRSAINRWVGGQTNQKIKELILPGTINPTTRLVLVNALYFKGPWADQFNSKATYKQNFYATNGQIIKVDMMHKMGKYKLLELDQLDAMALEMPFAGDRLSMTFILPNRKDGLRKLEEEFGIIDLSDKINSKVPGHRMYEKEVAIAIPKFKIESTHNLKDSLKRIGLKHMFESGKADFSGITDTKELFVSEVIQKAFIEVNEEGSEASAATALMFSRSAARNQPSPPEFTCDHPFMFMIRDHFTGIILFSGKITNPVF